MKQQARLYAGKDVEMLLVAAVIIKHAIANKNFLIAKRSTWVDPFFDNLFTKIDAAFSTLLNINNAKDLRDATQALLSIQKSALDDLVELKVQLEVDFEDEPQTLKNILSDLGFTNYYTAAKRKKDQEALIQLLFKFDTALTAKLKLDIVTAGTSADLLDNIVGYAKVLRDANVTQETAKDLRKDASDEKVSELNAIYKSMIGVARIASTFYKNQPLEKAKFSYSGNLKQLNLQTKKVDKPE